MPEVLVDIPEPDLRLIEAVGKEEHRKRKNQIELIVDEWCERRRKEEKEK